LNPWQWHVPVLFFSAVLILVFFLLDVYVRKLRTIGISSVIAFGLLFVSIAVMCVPAFFNITGIKTAGHVISFLAHWPTAAAYKILNLEHLSISSYNLTMLLEIGKYVVNTFMIFGIIRLMLYTKYQMKAKTVFKGD